MKDVKLDLAIQDSFDEIKGPVKWRVGNVPTYTERKVSKSATFLEYLSQAALPGQPHCKRVERFARGQISALSVNYFKNRIHNGKKKDEIESERRRLVTFTRTQIPLNLNNTPKQENIPNENILLDFVIASPRKQPRKQDKYELSPQNTMDTLFRTSLICIHVIFV